MSACTVPGSVGRLLDQTKHEIDRFSCHSECAPTIKLCLCVLLLEIIPYSTSSGLRRLIGQSLKAT